MKYSIIIPAYNVKKYLPLCISSLLNQTCRDFEIILVDDGSIDGTKELCDFYSSAQIKVFHKENGGVSSARNLGLDKASGDYIIFIDADDFVDKNFLEVYNILISSTNADVLYSNNARVNEGYIPNSAKDVKYGKVNKYDYRAVGMTGCAFKREYIENLRFFENVHLGEDILFGYLAAIKANCIMKVLTPMYFYVAREGQSSTLGTLTVEKCISMVEGFKEASKILKNDSLFTDGALNCFKDLYTAHCETYMRSYLQGITTEDNIIKVLDYVKQTKDKIFSSKNILS